MNTRRFSRPGLYGLLAFLVFTSLPASAADEDSVTSQLVVKGIHMLSGKGGNIGLMIGADGTFLIDDQFAPATQAILDAINAVGGTAPRFLFNTHYHGDHTGGNENFGTAGAVIMAHDKVRSRLASGYEIKAFNRKTEPAPAAALPVVTYGETLSLHINGEQIRAIHVSNAHTDGDSVLHFTNSNVIHTGDIFFNGFFPFIDVEHGGSLPGMLAAVNRILEIANQHTAIIPGHGPLASRKDLVVYRDMLQTALDRLSALRGEKLSAAQAIARQPLADLDKTWGKVMFTADKWIALVYETVP